MPVFAKRRVAATYIILSTMRYSGPSHWHAGLPVNFMQFDASLFCAINNSNSKWLTRISSNGTVSEILPGVPVNEIL